jgi:ribonuclease D
MNIYLHQYDLPDSFIASEAIAIDTEAMGLLPHRDRLCVVQLSNGDGDCHLVQFQSRIFDKSPNLIKMLTDKKIQKIFHYARFDVGLLSHSFGITMENIYCTKIASRLTRTYSNKHGLKDLCKELLGVELSKQEQTSDWGQPVLTKEQQTYAATDVLHLHALRDKLNVVLERESRSDLAKVCFAFLPTRAQFDREAGENFDIFSYKCD